MDLVSMFATQRATQLKYGILDHRPLHLDYNRGDTWREFERVPEYPQPVFFLARNQIKVAIKADSRPLDSP